MIPARIQSQQVPFVRIGSCRHRPISKSYWGKTKTRPSSRFFDEGHLESYRVQPCMVMEIIIALCLFL